MTDFDDFMNYRTFTKYRKISMIIFQSYQRVLIAINIYLTITRSYFVHDIYVEFPDLELN